MVDARFLQDILQAPLDSSDCIVEGKVWAVVVTFNRKELLIDCLNGLARQTRALTGIVVVDNASSDGTLEMLLEKGFLKEQFLPVDQDLFEIWSCPKSLGGLNFLYVRLSSNSGGAGGFHEGIKRAHSQKADWIWVMDDDVEPDPGCLEGLMRFSDISHCLHPRKYFLDGIPHHWEGSLSVVTGKRDFQPDISFSKGFAFCTMNTGCFEGMLIHRDIVEKIGYPDKRFFIGMDDSTYGFLAHLHTPVLYLRDPFIRKKVDSCKAVGPISDRSIYYGMRNAFLLQSYLNESVPRYRFVRSCFLVVRFFDYALNILQSRADKGKAYRVLFRALKDGLRKKYGKGL